MTTVTLAPLGNYPTQTTPFGPVAIADGVTLIEVDVARMTAADPTVWPDPATRIAVTWDVVDGSGARISGGGFDAAGGSVSLHGTEIPTARMSVSVLNGPIRTSVAAQVS